MGPRGSVLCSSGGERSRSLIVGGPQEGMRRAGTENVASIVGMGKAAELASIYFEEENVRVRRLRDGLESEIVKQIPEASVNGNPKDRIPNITNITFSGYQAKRILKDMEAHGIYATSGAACTDGLSPSHVLLAMGLTPGTPFHRFGLGSVGTTQRRRSTMS